MGYKKKKTEKEKKVQEEPPVSYLQIFQYAKWYELLASILGVTAGLLSGGGVCFTLAQFGELSTAFVERTAQQDQLTSYLPLTTFFGGGRRLQNASNDENMKALVEDGTAMAIGSFTSVILSIILCTISTALLSWSALRQITRVRLLFLECVLRQDMTWFDTDTEFNMASKMSENMMKLKEGMGEKIGVVSNLVGTAIICLCQAFPQGWQLTLACVTVVPFSLAASVLLSNYQTRSSAREMGCYSQAGKQAEEVLKSVRTIVAFGGENGEVES